MSPDLNDLYVALLLSSIIMGDSNASGLGILMLAKAMVTGIQAMSEALRNGVVAELSTQKHVSKARLIKVHREGGLSMGLPGHGQVISLLSKMSTTSTPIGSYSPSSVSG